MMNLKAYLITGITVTCIVGSLLIMKYRISFEEKSDNPEVKFRAGRKGGRGNGMEYVRNVVTKRGEKYGRRGIRKSGNASNNMFTHMKAEDRRLALAVQDALDSNDFKAVVNATQSALKSSNPEVRENAVEALGWFGAQALPELTPLMADRNEDVANAAINCWQQGLSEIEENETRAKIAEAVMPSIFNRDALEMIVTEITGQDDELKIMQSLVDLMECGNDKVVSVVREEYESLTGEEWESVEKAEAWLQENYEEPEE